MITSTVPAVGHKFKRGAYKKHKWYTRWFCRFLRLRMPINKVAKFMNISRGTIQNWSPGKDPKWAKRWAIAIPLLGKESDASIGRKSGFTRASIWNKRRELGIPPFVLPPSTKRRTVHDRNYQVEKKTGHQTNQNLLTAWKVT